MGRGGLPDGNESGKALDMRSRMWVGVGNKKKTTDTLNYLN